MDPYEKLVAMVDALVAEYPEAGLRRRPLGRTRGGRPQLVVERSDGDDLRVVHLPAVDEPVVSFYWGQLPPPRTPMDPTIHGEGHRYGDPAFVRDFLRSFLCELRPWQEVQWWREPGSPPVDDPDSFIGDAISRGEAVGLERLAPRQMLIYLISEAEVRCDMDGIDSFIDAYGLRGIRMLADAYACIGARELAQTMRDAVRLFPDPDDQILSVANSLICDRRGYSQDSVEQWLRRAG